jgi:CubicO group peptidase (beta-lactamase class C family)
MKTKLKRICDDFIRNHNFSGACLVKQGDDTLLECACGMAHKGFQIPNNIDTKFNTASITKVFTAVAVLQLVERGLFSLTDKITDLIDLSGTEIPVDITVEHLLTHSSGIANDVDDDESYDTYFLNLANYSFRNTADFLPYFVYKKPLFKAGTAASYNDCAFILLGLAIEKYSGEDYRAFVQGYIIEPLQLKNTAFCALDEVNENTAEGYFRIKDKDGNFIEWRKNIYSYPPIGTPDGGIYSTVGDLTEFMKSLREGTLLSPEYSELMMHPHCEYTWQDLWGNRPPVNIRPGYGLDFVEVDDRIVYIGKDGGYPGNHARMSYLPEIDVSVAILSNHDCNIWEMHRQMEGALGLPQLS